MMHQADVLHVESSYTGRRQTTLQFHTHTHTHTHMSFSDVCNGARRAKTSPASDDDRQHRAGRQDFCCRLASNASNIFSVADYCSVVSLSVVDIPLSSVKSDA